MRPTDKLSVFCWIDKIIESCTNRKQLYTCNKLVRNFEKMFPEELELNCILRSRENLKYWSLPDNV